MALDPKAWPAKTAGDLMKTEVVTIPETAPLTEAVRRLAEHRISGMPVTNESGHLTGVISIRDILDYESQEGGASTLAVRSFYAVADDDLDDDFEFGDVEVSEDSGGLVSDAMTAEVHSVDVQAPLSEIATKLVEHRIHRVLVSRNHKHVGIVSAMDVLAALLD